MIWHLKSTQRVKLAVECLLGHYPTLWMGIIPLKTDQVKTNPGRIQYLKTRDTQIRSIMCIDTAEIPGTGSPDQIHCLQTPQKPSAESLITSLSWSMRRGKLWGYGNVKWRKCDGWQWYDFNDCVPWNIFLYTRNTSRIVGIVSVLGCQACSGLRWQCLDDAPCLTVLNILLKGLTIPRVCGWLSRAIYDTCGSCGWCHDNVTRGHQERTSAPVDNERGVTSRLIGPDHYLLSNTNSWDFTQSLRSHRPLPPRLEGPSSVLWWEDTPETVSKVRAGRRGGSSITSVGGESRDWPRLCSQNVKRWLNILSHQRGGDRDKTAVILRARTISSLYFILKIFC